MIMMNETAAKEISGSDKYGLIQRKGYTLCSGFPQFNYTYPVHCHNNGIRRVKFKPFLAEVGAVRTLVVIVLHELTHKEKVERNCILAVIVVLIRTVTVLVSAPVYDCTLYRSHEEVNGK